MSRTRLACEVLIGVLILVAGATALRAAEVRGYEAWTLGMTKEEVSAISGSGPYSPVGSTGGLETTKGRFQGKRATVSFVFGAAGLRHIQVWAYEGQNLKAALKSFHDAYSYLSDTLGSVRLGSEPLRSGLTFAELDAMVPAEFRTGAKQSELGQIQEKGSIQAQVLKLHLHPQTPAIGAEVYASLLHSPQIGSYWVFLYVKSPSPAG